MEWLRLKRINKLNRFIRYLNLDRIYKNLKEICEGFEAEINCNKAWNKIPYNYLGVNVYECEDNESKQLFMDWDEKFRILILINNDSNQLQNRKI
ncbi:14486_t:CDS:2 [Entrophospora sp. SA101]|nr:14486_t:CDS:2 [Entrophospora sp. SA101]